MCNKIIDNIGIFSDDDINDAERLIEEALKRPTQKPQQQYVTNLRDDDKKKIKLEFLVGFEKGYKKTKSVSNGEYPLGRIKVNLTLGDLKVDQFKQPQDFGYGLGVLVGAMKFHPTYVLGDTTTVLHFMEQVHYLRDNKPEYYKMIEKRLKLWNEKIKGVIGELKEEEREHYKYLLKRL